MFDVGFWEISLIAVIALLVVGPDRLPGMARTVGLWVGRIRRYVGHVRDDIERELRAEELREIMQQSRFDDVKKSLDDAGRVVDETRRELESTADPAREPRAPGDAHETDPTGPPAGDAADVGRAVEEAGTAVLSGTGSGEREGAADEGDAAQRHDGRESGEAAGADEASPDERRKGPT